MVSNLSLVYGLSNANLEILIHAVAHLSPNDLSAIALVSRRFHDLVTAPHAWRTAFSRYFPGRDTLDTNVLSDEDEEDNGNIVRTERRVFARLSALASWRSEYILRTRLLRSLARGKPVQTLASPAAARTGTSHVAQPSTDYMSQLFSIVNHVHASFGNGLNKRLPRFIHGADDIGGVTSSDPAAGKIDTWGLSDPSQFVQFADRYAGDAMYGLGMGEIVGVPNVMDVSQPHGMVLGEGLPDGMVYYRFAEEMRGRFLASTSAVSMPELGIPKVLSTRESVCSVWIAKTSTLPSMTDGMIGIFSGSSLGVLTAYSLGPLAAKDQRFGRGEMTARWILCPGVPIVAIAVDEQYSMKRQAQNRIWAVVLNALGEVFYLTKFPSRTSTKPTSRFDDDAREKTAWLSGRSVYWNIVEPTRRQARPDPYSDTTVDGSYSPRTSWNGMCLSKNQIRSETAEVETFLSLKPRDFQKLCLGWDMRRRLEVDFAGDDGSNAGEAIIVIETALDEDTTAAIRRFTRCKVSDVVETDLIATPPLTDGSTNTSTAPSLFGGPAGSTVPSPRVEPTHPVSSTEVDDLPPTDGVAEEWRTSGFSLEGLKSVQISASALDCSTFATLTTLEDPLLNFSAASVTSSPSLTPLSMGEAATGPNDIPGQRARFLTVGTMLGTVLVWDVRAPVAVSTELTNTVRPVRIIHTESPQISCLAATALCIVHGGNDGLVQAWDPLGSSTSPIRTLHSRTAARARRRLIQAQASVQGVGINMFAAGAICLDPDPAVLRGVVSLGTQLRYWSYSSSAADQYRSHKRRLRRSERGSNGAERPTPIAHGNIKKFIANEKFELEQEEERHRRESARLAGRFGTELLGESATEEELLAYAALLSEESLAEDFERRTTSTPMAEKSTLAAQSLDVVPFDASTPTEPADSYDADVAEAIRLSLAASEDASLTPITYDTLDVYPEIPIRQARPRKRPTPKHSPALKPMVAEGSLANEANDLDFAIQLSLAEEQSRRDAEAALIADEFPTLGPSATRIYRGSDDKGKRRAS